LYYRRGSDGFVMKHGGWPHAKAHCADKGWTPLPKYGAFNDDEIAGNPFRLILERGGAHEFPWRRSSTWAGTGPGFPVATRRPGRLPQIKRTEDGGLILDDGTVLTEPKCPHCSVPTYFLSEQLLRNHESIRHSEIAQTDSMVRGMSTATQATAAATAGKLDEAIRVLAEGQEQIAARLDQQASTTNALLERFLQMTTPADREVEPPRRGRPPKDEQPPA
jgi:hypothetical protein